MTAPDPLLQHLERLAAAYGSDLHLPVARAERAPAPGTAAPKARSTEPPPPSRPASPPPQPTRPAARPAPSSVPAPASASAPAAPAAVDPLQALRAEVMPCTRCKLHQGRTCVVFGEGNPKPRVLFVGEAPGLQEDRTGRPFVGPSGQLLDKIIGGAMGMARADVYIANVNKCRPPDNREPEPDEVAACLPYLRRQIEILKPEVIVCLGRVAAQNLLGTNAPARALRGQTLDFHGTPVIVTWHPSYLLRDPSHKRETWDDIKRVNRLLGLPEVPGKPGPNHP
ncbi:MAG: uracil-DNA glycosylase [Planctomycetes bacterium]|nr:uracil-DNA glycosylase [Planctomycetota bacterium]